MPASEIRGFETSYALLRPYSALALIHKHNKDAEETSAKIANRAEKPSVDLGVSVALVVLNASILEGTLRSILSEFVAKDIEAAVKEGKKLGRNEPSKPEILLEKYQSDLETTGGWERLKGQFVYYLGKSLDAVMNAQDKQLTEAINVLFVLRNVFAHGTAFIQPTVKMDESMKDLYPFDWQSKLQRATTHLVATFKGADAFEALANYELPGYFFSKTQEFLKILAKEFDPLNERAAKLVYSITHYSFGYRL